MLFNTALFTSLLALSPAPTAAISQITRTGKYLYNDGGERFYIKGVAYQPQGEVGPSSEANDAKYVHAGHLVLLRSCGSEGNRADRRTLLRTF